MGRILFATGTTTHCLCEFAVSHDECYILIGINANRAPTDVNRRRFAEAERRRRDVGPTDWYVSMLSLSRKSLDRRAQDI